jgi:type IV secretion system protein VirB10
LSISSCPCVARTAPIAQIAEFIEMTSMRTGNNFRYTRTISMKFPNLVVCFWLTCLSVAAQDSDHNFAGVWRLQQAQSEIHPGPISAAETLKIDQVGDVLTCSTGCKYKLDGTETKFPIGQGFTSASRTKWEGRALLISSAVSGPRTFSVHDRWTLSRDHNTLRIRRQIVTLHGETESNLVYEREGAVVSQAAPQEKAPEVIPRQTPKQAAKQELTYTVEAGTKIPLRLINSVSTKTAGEGDRIYLETAFPVVAEGRIVIPTGSAVAGTITNVERPGRVKGRGELYLRFDSVVLANGVVREFRARPDALDGDAGGVLDREEGKIQSPGSKAADAKTAGKAAATGAAIGSIAGRGAMGAGVGAAGGAAAGLAGVLLSRGADTVLARGAILEMQLDRPLVFSESELSRR